MKLKWLFPNVLTICFVVIGAALLYLTIMYRVNPVEGSVVEPSVRGTALHYVLLFTTMPAWIAGFLLSGMLLGCTEKLAIVLMFLFQVLFYYFLGKLISLIVAIIRNHRRKSSGTP